MQDGTITGAMSESQFAALVDALATDPDRREQLSELLREAHPLYNERGAAATVRMRGWVLLALARVGVSDAALCLPGFFMPPVWQAGSCNSRAAALRTCGCCDH